MQQQSEIHLRDGLTVHHSTPATSLEQLDREIGESRDAFSPSRDWSEAERWELFSRFHRYLDWKEAMSGDPIDGREGGGDEALRLETARLVLEPVLPELEAQARLILESSPASRSEILFEASGPDLWVEASVASALREFLLHAVRNSLAHAFSEREHSDFLAAPRITLRLGCVGDSIQIQVSDNGRGVDWDELLCSHQLKTGIRVSSDALGPESALELLCSPWTSTAAGSGDLGAGSGLGLMGLQSRILDLGGRLGIPEKNLRSTDGFTIEARIPCRAVGGECVRVGEQLSPSFIASAHPQGPGRFRYFHRVSPAWFPALFDSAVSAGSSGDAGMLMAALWYGELLPLAPAALS